VRRAIALPDDLDGIPLIQQLVPIARGAAAPSSLSPLLPLKPSRERSIL